MSTVIKAANDSRVQLGRQRGFRSFQKAIQKVRHRVRSRCRNWPSLPLMRCVKKSSSPVRCDCRQLNFTFFDFWVDKKC